MKNVKFLFVFAAFAFALVGCSKAPDFNGMASEMCDCSKDMMEVYEKIQSGSAAPEEMLALSGKMETLSADMEKCIEGLEKKYENIKETPENETKLKEAVKASCPKLGKLMEGMGQ